MWLEGPHITEWANWLQCTPPPTHLHSPIKLPSPCCPGRPAAASDLALLFGFGLGIFFFFFFVVLSKVT